MPGQILEEHQVSICRWQHVSFVVYNVVGHTGDRHL